jgi:predicted HTH transcriptional regulator
MGLDGILHDGKHFGELEDGDLERFLESRKFRSEHLNLEFKSGFPRVSPRGRFNIEKICQYVVAFLNGEGGFVIYGVADTAQATDTSLTDIVVGVSSSPSIEDISQWVNERIYPLPPPVGVRTFAVLGRMVVVSRVPAGNDKPYAYYDPATRITKYFQRSAGGIRELKASEIRDFFRESLVGQASIMLERVGGNLLALLGFRQWRIGVWKCPK